MKKLPAAICRGTASTAVTLHRVTAVSVLSAFSVLSTNRTGSCRLLRSSIPRSGRNTTCSVRSCHSIFSFSQRFPGRLCPRRRFRPRGPYSAFLTISHASSPVQYAIYGDRQHQIYHSAYERFCSAFFVSFCPAHEKRDAREHKHCRRYGEIYRGREDQYAGCGYAVSETDRRNRQRGGHDAPYDPAHL